MKYIRRAAIAAAMWAAATGALYGVAAIADGGRVYMARLVLADGRPVSAAMLSRAACVAFTRTIARHVESANCETLTRKEIRS